MEISRRRGVGKAKEKYGAKSEFSEGSGGVGESKPKKPLVRDYGYFLESH